MNALAWSLLHFLWQGAAIAALAAILMHAFKSPSTRYLVGVGALALMLTSFAVTFGWLRGSAGNGAEWSLARDSVTVAANAVTPGDSAPLSFEVARVATVDEFLWLARAWLAGVFALALRIAFGLLVLVQLRRSGLVELPGQLVARFERLQRRIGVDRLVRYCECAAVRVPAVIGLFRPVVLIPVRALTGLSPEQLEAVVAHELGHVKRFDVAVNFVQAVAETLFFFHPAVWWLNRRVRALREDCCDDIAVDATGGRVGYARALATMAEWRDAPHFAMAATGGPIAARVARLLGVRASEPGRTAGAMAVSVALAAALIAGGVSIGWANRATAAEPADGAPASVAAPRVDASPSTRTSTEVAARPAARVVAAPVVRTAPSTPLAPKPAASPKPPRAPSPAAPAAPAMPATPAAPPAPAARDGSYILDMKNAGYDGLDVDELVALKVQGVTPDYVAGMRGAGLDPNVDQVISMKVQGVTPEYVQQVRAMGFEPDASEIIAMKVQGISPEYVRQVRDLGFEPDVNEIIGLKVQGVSADYVREMRKVDRHVDADQIIALKVQGVTPDYVREMHDAGFDTAADDLISLKVQGVTPEFRRQLKSAGLDLDTHELIEAKVMGITPEFVAKAASHGFKNLDIHKLIQLKNAGVF